MRHKALAIALLLAYSPLQADWNVSKVSGDAWREHDQQKTALKDGDHVGDKETVSTGHASRLELRNGGDVLAIGSGSRLKLHPQNVATDPGPLSLLYGKVRATITPRPENHFMIETKAAVAGVRGTEYFVQSDADHDFICTLKGLVNVQSKLTQQSILVPPKAGVEIATGKAFTVAPTPDDLIDSWINETSTDEHRPVVADNYEQLGLRFHEVAPSLYIGVRADALLGHTENVGYNSLGSNAHNDFSQARITPAIRWGDKTALVWEPRVLLHSSSQEMLLQADPLLARNQYQRGDLGELYAETTALAANLVRVGQQSVTWNDGVWFTSDQWRLDPLLFQGVRVSKVVGEHYFDLLMFAERSRNNELGGSIPAGIFALKYDYATWFSVFVDQRDYAFSTTADPATTRGHSIEDIGIQSSRRFGRVDYKLTFVQQGGYLFEHTPQLSQMDSAHMMEIGVGGYPLAKENLRVGATYIESDPLFVPGYESNYNLGFSQAFQRTNLRQFRGKLSYAPHEGQWSAFLEWIRSQSVGYSPLVLWSGAGSNLMDEADLGLTHRCLENLAATMVLFHVAPTSVMSASSPRWSNEAGFGLLANVQYTY